MRDLRMLLPAAVAVAAVAGEAQAQRRVTGVVTASGAGGGPIPAATVQVVGTTVGTVTNEQGQFSVTVPANATTLRVRRIGYQQRQVALSAGQTQVNVSLERDVLQLEQVVVTGQSTTTERRNATTATAVVTADEVIRAPAPSLEYGLQGKVVGANINLNSGAPGGGGQIQIRGITSIIGNGQPLIVVDGVIFSNDATSPGTNSVTGAATGAANITSSSQDNPINRLADINPNDIESVEVLKSAAATAIYGSRATNGVILIRTKRGVAGQTRATLTQRVGTQSALRLPGQRRFETAAEAFEYADAYGVDSAAVAGIITANGGTVPYNRFDKQFFDRGTPSYESILSASGGSERTQFFVSGTNRQENGIAPRTGARLQSGRVNLDQTFNARLRGSVGVAFTRNETNRGLSNNDNSYTSPLYAFPYTPSFLPLRRNADGTFPENIAQGGGANISNPFQTFQFLDLTEDTYRTIGSGNLTYTAFQDARNRVDLVGLFGVDRSQSEGSVLSPGFLQFEPNDGFLGTSQQSNASTRNINTSLSANHTFTGGTFQVVSSVGTTYEEQQQNVYRLLGRGNLPGIPRTDVGSVTNTLQQFFLFRDQSVFLNTQLTALNERLNLAGGFRADRSSANGNTERFFVFPRASVSYRFEGLIPGVDNIKPRIAYGQTGNRPVYSLRDVLLANGGVISGSTGIVANTVVGNPGIKPERLVEQEYGLDASLFGQRAQLEATYYDRTVRDFLLQPAVAPSTGLNVLAVNAGKLRTAGVELGLTTVPVQTRTVTWTSRATFQTFETRIQNLPGFIPPFVPQGLNAFGAPGNISFGASFGRNRVQPGQRATLIWGNAPFERNAQGVPVRELPMGSYATLTQAERTALNVASRDTIIGDANPDFQMFFTNTFRVRNVGLSFLLDWRKGGDLANMTRLLYDEGANSRDYEDASPVAGVQQGDYRYRGWNNGQDARMYVESGTYLKVREIALTFDVPQAAVRRLGRLSAASLQLQARNPFMFTNYWSVDPEVNNFGAQNLNRFIDLAPFPPARQFFLSANVTF